MKAGIAVPLFGALLGVTVFLIPSAALSGTATARSGLPTSGTTTTTTTVATEDRGASWKQTASDAAHNAEVATENAYKRVARSVRDVSLEGRVMAVLHENKFTRESDVHVMADNGVVTLTGSVPSERHAQRVQEVVASVYGVKSVNNNLNYPHSRQAAIPPDSNSTGVARPAYSDTAPAENAPGR